MRLARLAALAAFSALAGSSPLLAQAPGGIALVAADLTGDGCPPGSAVINVSPDAQAFTVMFGRYVVEAGGHLGAPTARKSCNLDLAFAVPPGWTFSVEAVDFRGYVALDPGARGNQMSSVSYPPRTALTRLASLDLFGPASGDYQHHIDIPARNRIMAPCTGATRRMLLRTTLGVTTQRLARGLMTVDSVDGNLVHRYLLDWHQCPGFGR